MKAIETYIAVFNHIKDRFARDMNVFTLGLFTFFPNASIQIKPLLIKMFEDYFMPLGKSLIPCSSAFIMTLLTGLEEEEGTTLYAKCLTMIDAIRKFVEDDLLFFRIIWDNILSVKSSRLPGFKYLILTCKRNEKEILIVCKNRSIAIHSIIISLQDDIQTQRICLDFLLFATNIFSEEDSILYAMLLLLLKDDMSINRRIFQYLFDKGNLDLKTLLKTFKTLFLTESATPKILATLKKDDTVYLCIFDELILEMLRFVEKFEDKTLFDEIITSFPKQFWKGLESETIQTQNFGFVMRWLQRVDEFDHSTLTKITAWTLEAILSNHVKTKDLLHFLLFLVTSVIDSQEDLFKVYDASEKIYINFTRTMFKPEVKEFFQMMITIMIHIHKKIKNDQTWFIRSVLDACNNPDINIALYAIHSLSGVQELPEDVLKSLNLICWNLLKKNNEEYWYEITKLLVEFYKRNKSVSDNFLGEELTSESTRIEAHKRFALLWKLLNELNITRVFDHGLLLMIDSLKSEHAFQCLISKTWLLNSMSNIKHILDTLLFLLIDVQHKNKATIFDERRSKYIMKLLISMVQVDPELFIKHCSTSDLSSDLVNEYARFFVKDIAHNVFHMPSHQFSIPVRNYLDLVVSVSVKLLECDNQDELNSDIKSNCISFLKTILLQQNYNLTNVILHHLQSSIESKDYVFQIELLEILSILMKSNSIETVLLNQIVNFGIQESDQETLTYWITYMTQFLVHFKEEHLFSFVKNLIGGLTKNFTNPSIIGLCNIYQYILKEFDREVHSTPPPTNNTFSLMSLFVQEKPKESWLKKTKNYLFSNVINDIIYQMIIKEYKNSSTFLLMLPRSELVKSFVSIWFKINPEITNSFEVKLKEKNIQDPLLNLIKNMNISLEEFLKVSDLLHVGINLVTLYVDKFTLDSYSIHYIVINHDLLCLGMSLKLCYKIFKKDPSQKIKFKDTVNKLVEQSIIYATKECMDKQKIINQNNLIEQGSNLDLSSQIFQLISEISSDIIVDHNAISIGNLFSILKIYNYDNLTRMRSILQFLRNFKTIKKEVLDLFYEPQFFFCDHDGLVNWKYILNEYFSLDHGLFMDLLQRFGSTQSIFLSSEEEALQKGRLIKRMSFILFSGKVDEYHKEIPTMIEKIVECLRHSNSETILHQVLICFRMMIYKFSPKRLSIVWPTIITQLIKILEGEPPSPAVLIQLSKLVDYCMILLPEAFQPYKWIFVNHLDYKNEEYFRPLLKGEMTDGKQKKIGIPMESPKNPQNMEEVDEFVGNMMNRQRQELWICSNLKYDVQFVEIEYLNDFVSQKVLNFKREFD